MKIYSKYLYFFFNYYWKFWIFSVIFVCRFFAFANMIGCAFSVLSLFLASVLGHKGLVPKNSFYMFLHDLVRPTLTFFFNWFVTNVVVLSINVDAPSFLKELKSYYNNNNILSVVLLVGSEDVMCMYTLPLPCECGEIALIDPRVK